MKKTRWFGVDAKRPLRNGRYEFIPGGSSTVEMREFLDGFWMGVLFDNSMWRGLAEDPNIKADMGLHKLGYRHCMYGDHHTKAVTGARFMRFRGINMWHCAQCVQERVKK